jgi:hypothetical protein
LRISDLIDDKTLLRLQTMTTEEVEALSAMELALWVRVSIELKSWLGDLSPEETTYAGFRADLPAPTFVIQSIPLRPSVYCYVRFGDDPIRDGWTWIREKEVTAYREAHPDHFVIV